MKLNAVSCKKVEINDSFWSPRIETNRKVTLPIEYEQCRKTGRLDAFKWVKGMPHKPHFFWDSDVAKWIEAAAYSLAKYPDEELKNKVDEVIDTLVSGQEADGYLNSYFTRVKPEEKWTNLRIKHELYCAGHLMEAAVAYHQCTGERKLLDALCRYADLICKKFGKEEGQVAGYPGHQEVELALVKMYRETGKKRYLDLAQFFIKERGKRPLFFVKEGETLGIEVEDNPSELRQYHCHKPADEQDSAEGHAVRACYYYAGMADVAVETGDEGLYEACRKIWKNLVNKRMYVTGGIGSSWAGERFTYDYDLPNETSYSETCAAISLVFFAQRMLNAEADSEYADVMELALYNGVLSGVSLDGQHFFYANRLEADPAAIEWRKDRYALERQEWFECACCPPNIARLLASLGGYIYSQSENAVWTHLYIGGKGHFDINGQKVSLSQKTDYPWSGKVEFEISIDTPAEFSINFRIPGWCRNAQIKLNGESVDFEKDLHKGYAHVKREWKDSDKIELDFAMPIELIKSHPSVSFNAGRVAIKRGPVVYCIEEVDNGKNLKSIVLPADLSLELAEDKDSPANAPVIIGKALRYDMNEWEDCLYTAEQPKYQECDIKAVPYCLWANRKAGEMLVWIKSFPRL